MSMDSIDDVLENAKTRADLIQYLTEGNMEKGVFVFQVPRGDWHRVWFNMTKGDLVFASAVLQKAALNELTAFEGDQNDHS